MTEGLASVYIDQGRFTAAEDLLANAARDRVALLGNEHPSMVGNRIILGKAYTAQGKHADAEKAYREALGMAEKASGGENSVVSNLLALVADSCVMQRKYYRAADLYARSVAIDEKVSAPEPIRSKHLRNYANVLKVMGRADEAAKAEERAEKAP